MKYMIQMKRGFAMILYIKVGSITNAQRGQKVLNSNGFKSKIKRIENPDKTDGCGYALEVSADDKTPVEILEKNKIKVRGAEWQ